MEIWKDIEGYEGAYQVSNLGNVRSLNYNNTGKVKNLKKQVTKRGRYVVGLSIKGKSKTLSVSSTSIKSLFAYAWNAIVVCASKSFLSIKKIALSIAGISISKFLVAL